MRVLAVTTAILLSCTLGPSLAGEMENAATQQAQAAIPVQPDQTPQQAEQAREQDRKNAEDVKIGRDWKAESGGDRVGHPDQSDQDHQTVGRDWRTRPDNDDRR
ncbi:hypothetical protein [Bradyrhizobium sp. LA7.1]|uniref:hypothetical protein n=1 Tax=Bradyrhizobium sp. LA7.1 TaxID=3156324 RepID=UPI00339357AE